MSEARHVRLQNLENNMSTGANITTTSIRYKNRCECDFEYSLVVRSVPFQVQNGL